MSSPAAWDRDRLLALHKEALEEQEKYLSINQQLQKRIVDHLREKKVFSWYYYEKI